MNAPSPFSQSKVQITQTKTSSLSKASMATQELVLILDVKCALAEEEPLIFFDQTIELSAVEKTLNKAAINLGSVEVTDQETLNSEMERSTCFVGLVNEKEVSAGQVSQKTSDTYSSQQKHLSFVGYEDTLTMQQSITSKVRVAFVDTGVDYSHTDLAARMWVNSSNRPGYDFYNSDDDPMDDNGHGTHVAGLVGAIENNNSGVSGLTGDYIEIMAVKALSSSGSGQVSRVVNGIQYAIANGADIINLSIEIQGQSAELHDAILDAVNNGVLVIGAIGNQSAEVTATNIYSPAYSGPLIAGMLSVASVDTNDNFLSSFSNYGTTYAEIAAPGSQSGITTGLMSLAPNEGVQRLAGTSQAAPIISAAAALLIGSLKSKGITYTPGAIESFLKSDGSMKSESLSAYVNSGNIINLKHLSENMTLYFGSYGSETAFNPAQSNGSSCYIN